MTLLYFPVLENSFLTILIQLLYHVSLNQIELWTPQFFFSFLFLSLYLFVSSCGLVQSTQNKLCIALLDLKLSYVFFSIGCLLAIN